MYHHDESFMLRTHQFQIQVLCGDGNAASGHHLPTAAHTVETHKDNQCVSFLLVDVIEVQ